MSQLLQPLLGIIVFICLAWLMSEKRSAVSFKAIAAGLLIQFFLALILLKMPGTQQLFLALNSIVNVVQQATDAGTSFVFGFLGGGSAPFDITQPANNFILAFKALPLVLVVSALSSLLFYWRVIPLIVNAIAWLLQKSFGISGALGLGAAMNIFVGMTEAPLLIRPYLKDLSRAELFALMSCGMATIAGTVMVLYAAIVGSAIEGAMGHILVASLLSVPSVLMLSHIMVPEQISEQKVQHNPQVQLSQTASSSMDAITTGTINGIQLLINIIALLIVFVALVHLANQIIALVPWLENEPLTLQKILGWIMAPLVWLAGIPWSEAQAAGSLMGIKTVLNEFIAYLQLAQMEQSILSEHSKLIMLYAMCGFANLGSLGIMIGGLGAMAPERRNEIVELGFKSIIAGTLATLMTGAVAGILL